MNVAGHIIVSEEKLNLVACSICVELNLLCLLSSLLMYGKDPLLNISILQRASKGRCRTSQPRTRISLGWGLRPG